jgi:hypothetical protein
MKSDYYQREDRIVSWARVPRVPLYIYQDRGMCRLDSYAGMSKRLISNAEKLCGLCLLGGGINHKVGYLVIKTTRN